MQRVSFRPPGFPWSRTCLPHPTVPPLSSIRPLFTPLPPLTSLSASPSLYHSFTTWYPQASYRATGSLAPSPGPLAPWLPPSHVAPRRPFSDPVYHLSVSLCASFLPPWLPPLHPALRRPFSDPYHPLSSSLSASFLTSFLTFTSQVPSLLPRRPHPSSLPILHSDAHGPRSFCHRS